MSESELKDRLETAAVELWTKARQASLLRSVKADGMAMGFAGAAVRIFDEIGSTHQSRSDAYAFLVRKGL